MSRWMFLQFNMFCIFYAYIILWLVEDKLCFKPVIKPSNQPLNIICFQLLLQRQIPPSDNLQKLPYFKHTRQRERESVWLFSYPSSHLAPLQRKQTKQNGKRRRRPVYTGSGRRPWTTFYDQEENRRTGCFPGLHSLGFRVSLLYLVLQSDRATQDWWEPDRFLSIYLVGYANIGDLVRFVLATRTVSPLESGLAINLHR